MFNRSIVIISLFFILLITSKAARANYDIYNEAPNPSFEDGSVNPNGWVESKGFSCNVQIQTDNTHVWENNFARTGNKSLAFKNINWSSEPKDKPVWITKDFISVDLANGPLGINIYITGENSNQNLRANMFLCFYDENDNNLGMRNTDTSLIYDVGWENYANNISSAFDGNVSKIKIGLTPLCLFNRPCSGNIWFDDIGIRHQGSGVTIEKFYDYNKNGSKDSNDGPLEWQFQLYDHQNCLETNDRYPNYIYTTPETGSRTRYINAGEYSAREIVENGWANTTPLCQNFTVSPLSTELPSTLVSFGNYHGPIFPYLSQLDPAWKDLEYDHASSIGPFFCGTTIGGCGCAITSSAMLLNYYGANKAPNGQPTNPATLNDWLKQNSGYAFGALKWNSVAAYSVKANTAFGTQKIRFVSVGSANDFQTLDSDLANKKPDILEEPGHFIVASEKNSPTYAISDPAYQSRQTLAAYQNSFSSMRRFEKTNTDLSALYISTPTPNDLFITDSLGRRAGKDPQSGQVLTEIPNSYYFLEPSLIDQTQQNAQTPNSGVSTLVIINPPQDTFNLQSQSGPIDVSAYDTYGNIKVKNFSPISPDSFEINYSPEPSSDFSVFQKVAIEVKPQNLNKGNGIIPIVIESDDNFNAQDVDFGSIRFTSTQIIPIKFPLLVQNGKDNKKDLQVFFYVNEIPPDPNLCLTGITMEGLTFKGCST